MKNLSIGPNIFFGKEVNFLKIGPGHMPERLPCWSLVTIDFRYFKLKFAGCKWDIPSAVEK
jgi:hypothetical protein